MVFCSNSSEHPTEKQRYQGRDSHVAYLFEYVFLHCALPFFWYKFQDLKYFSCKCRLKVSSVLTQSECAKAKLTLIQIHLADYTKAKLAG